MLVLTRTNKLQMGGLFINFTCNLRGEVSSEHTWIAANTEDQHEIFFQAILLIIGGVHTNPGPVPKIKEQLEFVMCNMCNDD